MKNVSGRKDGSYERALARAARARVASAHTRNIILSLCCMQVSPCGPHCTRTTKVSIQKNNGHS